jgi:hypothetical protein
VVLSTAFHSEDEHSGQKYSVNENNVFFLLLIHKIEIHA